MRNLSLLFLSVLLYAVPMACQADANVLTFDAPQTAGISGFRPCWDTPVPLAADGATQMVDKGQFGKAPSAIWYPNAKARQAADGTLKPGALAFDAVHRSLLVRFPGAAAAIAARLRGGETVRKIELALPFKDLELWPEGYAEPAGMSFLGTQWATWKPRWHAVAWALRRPWTADAQTGPTFNAFINGAGYWTKYGARDERQDRFPQRFGPAEVSSQNPDGRLDVTAVLTDPAFGAGIADRLRTLDACGFLVRKEEVYDVALWQGGYEWQTATGPRGILIDTPRLLVTFAPGQAVPIADAALTVDVPKLAAELQAAHTGGKPTAVLPDAAAIKALSARLTFSRPAWMPDWQWARVQELHQLGGGWTFPDTPETYNHWIDEQLAVAPRAWRGFDAPERVENYYKYLDALPAPVRDHWQLYWWAWLMPDRPFPEFDYQGKPYQFAQGYIGGKEAQAYYKATGDWRGNFSVYRTYCYAMGTMNFNNWNAFGTLGGGRILNSPLLMQDGSHGIEAWSFRTWSWFDGSTQESIDHYYFAESLKGQKGIADWSPTTFERMMGQSILAKSVEELSSSYHPNLRRFISSSGRTGIAYLLGIQDGLQSILHTLSPKGTLTDLATVTSKAPDGLITAPNVEKMPALGHNLTPGVVAQQTTNGPWAPEWVAGMVDDKPLPYEATNSYKMWGGYSATPLWKRSYLGIDYGLATLDVSTGNETVPVMAQWRRTEQPVESMTELGTLIARAGVNRTELLDSIWHEGKNRNPNGSVGMQGFGQFALQGRNKAIILTRPNEKLKSDRPVPEQITSLQTTLGLFNFTANPTWELYLDGQRVTQFPCKARLSQRITLKDGVSYVGIIPLPATDLGRTDEVVIADDGQMTEMQGGGKAREALRINLYNLQRDTPLDKQALDWTKIERAYNGFVIEMGDQHEYGDFAAFQRHLAAAKLDAVWDDAKGVLNLSYQSGNDLLECGFTPLYHGGPTTGVFPYRRINGQWPYNAPGIERDTTLTQQGTAGKLEKNGAVLTSEPGRMTYLQAEPHSGTYAASNAFPEATFLTFQMPGGATIQADGRLGMARLTVCPRKQTLSIDYALREDQQARPDMASALLVFGMPRAPAVTLNGTALTGKLAQADVDGKTAWLIPLTATPLPAPRVVARFKQAMRANEAFSTGKLDVSASLAQDWQIAGPFPLGAHAEGFDTAFAPEADYLRGALNLQSSYKGVNDAPVAWKHIPAAGKPAQGPGMVDLRRLLQPNENVVAYAYTTVKSDRERQAVLLTGSDDTLSAWINGQQVAKKNLWRGAIMDDDRTPVTLKAGVNTVLLKICQGGGAWGFFFRLGDEFGVPLDGVTYAAQ